MNKTKGLDFIKRYTMILVLIVVTAFFAWRTGGAILLPMNVSSLISQNAYVFILATGMLLCILTGGNIDLSVGSVVCFVGAIGAVLMVNMKMNMWLAILIMFVIGTLIGLVDMLYHMDDPSTLGPAMAVALITTLYGSLLANWICTPVSNKLKADNAIEMQQKEVMIEGLLSIQAGENPRVIEEKLKSFLSPSVREGVLENGGGGEE